MATSKIAERRTEFGQLLRNYTQSLKAAAWNTGPIKLLEWPKINYAGSRILHQNLAKARDSELIPDTFVYAFRRMQPVFTAADNEKGRSVAQRAALAGIPIIGYYPGQKNCNFFPEESHLFRIVSKGRYADTTTALEQFWGVILRLLERIGIPDPVISGNNLMVDCKRIGLLSGPKVKGDICLKTPIATDDTIRIGQSFNNQVTQDLGSIFIEDEWGITSLEQTIGKISPETMFTALSEVLKGDRVKC